VSGSIFGQIYSGPVVDNINVTDIIAFSKTEALAKESETTVNPGTGQLDPDIRQRIEDRKDWFFGQKGAPPPTTEAESLEISRQLDAAKQELAAIENYVSRVQATIESQINSQSVDGKEVAILLNTEGKASLKKSLRKLFGREMNRITLSDFKELLAARTALEQEAVLDYAKDFPGS
jgi:hypothetical protein